MEVLKRILDGSLSKQQQQRGQATLNAKYPPYNVERERLNNADKYFGEQVFALEKAQATAYNSSQMPISNEDKGKLYKIQAFANPLMGSLRGKLQLGLQLITAIEVAGTKVKEEAGGTSGAFIFTPDGLKNNYFGTKELLTEYNALMTYIKIYASSITANNQMNDKVNQGIMGPILQQLDQVLTSYANFWNSLPDGATQAQRIVKTAMKKLVEKNWVLYSTMYELVSNQEFRPLTDSDLDTYRRLNNVNADIFNNFPRAPPAPMPMPPTAPTPEQQQIQPVVPQQPVIPRLPPVVQPDQATIAQVPQAPQNLRNTSGQTISQSDYFFVLAYKWAENEEIGLVRQIIPDAKRQAKTRVAQLKTFETRLKEIQRVGQPRDVEGQLIQQIDALKIEIARDVEELKVLEKRKIILFSAGEQLADYLRETVKLPIDGEGDLLKADLRKVRPEDIRAIAQLEPAIRRSVSLEGFGKKMLGSKIDNKDDEYSFPNMGEFEMKKMMSLKARGDRNYVEPDQSIGSRLSMFDPLTEFEPKLELLKRGFKANDPVMEPDHKMEIMPVPNFGRYEASGLAEDENATAFKTAFGTHYNSHARRTNDRPVVPEYKKPFGGFFDIDGNDEFNTVKNFEDMYKPVEHFKVEEEPDDIMDHPDEFKRKIESYRFNTGRMKTKPAFMKAN